MKRLAAACLACMAAAAHAAGTRDRLPDDLRRLEPGDALAGAGTS